MTRAEILEDARRRWVAQGLRGQALRDAIVKDVEPVLRQRPDWVSVPQIVACVVTEWKTR